MDRKKREKIKRMSQSPHQNNKQPMLLIPDLTKFDKEIVKQI